MKKTAKLFYNGRSQAVRLPKEFRMPGTEVYVERDGDAIVLKPVATHTPRTLADELAYFRAHPVSDTFARTVLAARAADRKRGLRDFGAG
jgi:virulence-associated protein VagC